MTPSKSLLIICNSDLSREPRVIRQIIALKDLFNITTLGQAPSGIGGVEHINFIQEKRKPKHWNYPPIVRKFFSAGLKLYEKGKNIYPRFYYHRDFWNQNRLDTLALCNGKQFDLVIAHHYDALPLGYNIARAVKAKLVYNVHDYYERQFEDNHVWMKHQQPLVQFLSNKYIPECDLIFSAWTKIHEDYQKLYSVPSVIINNATEFNDLEPVFKNENEKIRIIHHGIANSNRKIELMIEMMDHLPDNFSLDLMLINSPYEMDYFNSLKQLAAKNPRIKFIDPVQTREISRNINTYDIGVFILPPNGFNPTYLLPNKLFEFVQARLACLVTPNIEMQTIVDKYKLGWVSEGFLPAEVARQVQNITQHDINNIKTIVHKHAHELSAEVNYEKIKHAIMELFNETPVKPAEIIKTKHPAL